MGRISNIFKKIISVFLASLGFSCLFFACAYGAPYATYKARGTVVSEADNSPIEGIKASFLRPNRYYDEEYDEEEYQFFPIATTYTSNNGAFSLKSNNLPTGKKLYVELLDVDGEINGSFIRMEIEVDYSNEKLTGGSGEWYSGVAEINLGTIKMKPEE